MPSSFTPNKNLELQVTGSNVGTWGSELNTAVFTILDQCLGNPTTISLSNVPVTLSTSQLQSLSLLFTGTLTANVTVTIPAVGGMFFMSNATTGQFTLTIASAGAGTSQVLPVGYGSIFVTDGTNVYNLVQPDGGFTNIVGAATVDLGTVPNGLVNVTGSGATITSFGLTAQNVQSLFFVKFGGTNTITNSSSILCPGNTSIVTQLNDTFLVWNTGGGVYRIVGAFLASGLPLVGATGIYAPVMQTVLSGPKDVNGNPTFLPSTSGTLTITAQGLTTTPLVLTSPSGYNSAGLNNTITTITTNPTWTCVSNSTTYLGWNFSTQTAFSTTIPPLYQRGGSISTTAGQYTFDIIAAQMYLGNGTAINPVNVVFVGEAHAAASTITSTAPYAYQGIYESGFTATLPNGGVLTTVSSNIGILDQTPTLALICLTNDVGFLAGQRLNYMATAAAGANTYPLSMANDTNTVSFTPGAANPWIVANRTNGQPNGMTLTSWAWQVSSKRNW